MSSESEIIDVLSRVANIFLKAVDALETRMMIIEQRIDEMERGLAGAASSGSGAQPPAAQDIWRVPPSTTPPPQQTQRVEAYGASQAQWGSQKQEPYPPQPTPSRQTRAQSYPQQQTQPAPYPPPAQPQGAPYGPPGAPPQGPPPAGAPRPLASPLNVRQAVTGELKEVFAKMRARAEGR